MKRKGGTKAETGERAESSYFAGTYTGGGKWGGGKAGREWGLRSKKKARLG